MESEVKDNQKIMDEKDKKIIKALFEDGRMSVAEIEKKTHIRRDSIARRLKKLQREKVLSFIPFLEPKSIGLPNLALVLIRVKTNPKESREKFIQKMSSNKYIFHLSKIIGKFDFFSVLVYKDTNHLNQLSEEIRGYVANFIEDFEVYPIAEEYKVEDMSSLL
jgi:Lrp/AsnC family leucine-responsive transcriptional regulator